MEPFWTNFFHGFFVQNLVKNSIEFWTFLMINLDPYKLHKCTIYQITTNFVAVRMAYVPILCYVCDSSNSSVLFLIFFWISVYVGVLSTLDMDGTVLSLHNHNETMQLITWLCHHNAGPGMPMAAGRCMFTIRTRWPMAMCTARLNHVDGAPSHQPGLSSI